MQLAAGLAAGRSSSLAVTSKLGQECLHRPCTLLHRDCAGSTAASLRRIHPLQKSLQRSRATEVGCKLRGRQQPRPLRATSEDEAQPSSPPDTDEDTDRETGSPPDTDEDTDRDTGAGENESREGDASTSEPDELGFRYMEEREEDGALDENGMRFEGLLTGAQTTDYFPEDFFEDEERMRKTLAGIDVPQDVSALDDSEEYDSVPGEDDPDGLPWNQVGVQGGRTPGYTPFEAIVFGEEEVSHELVVHVDAPVSNVFQIWENRLNYCEWFDLIGQVALHRDDPRFASYFLFYKFGMTPVLELYSTLHRSHVVENELIVEESVDGMQLVVAAKFAEHENGGTDVTLNVGYVLPKPLETFVGVVAVWGDVNDILKENLYAMKLFVEGADLDELQAARATDLQHMDEMADERKLDAEKFQEGLAEALLEDLAPFLPLPMFGPASGKVGYASPRWYGPALGPASNDAWGASSLEGSNESEDVGPNGASSGPNGGSSGGDGGSVRAQSLSSAGPKGRGRPSTGRKGRQRKQS
ncbi:hypothetical protein WJX72_000223 [[Myrmecia] bisecta]|uniref:Uncharacterized protein n=1 Tax=[Myrmecia] bisecta TaxID=41462 RepID=A0AAW1P6G3_9CHLO